MDRVRISWDVSPTGMVYNVYRSTNPAYDGGVMTKIGSTANLYVDDASASSGLIYYLLIRFTQVDATTDDILAVITRSEEQTTK